MKKFFATIALVSFFSGTAAFAQTDAEIDAEIAAKVEEPRVSTCTVEDAKRYAGYIALGETIYSKPSFFVKKLKSGEETSETLFRIIDCRFDVLDQIEKSSEDDYESFIVKSAPHEPIFTPIIKAIEYFQK